MIAAPIYLDIGPRVYRYMDIILITTSMIQISCHSELSYLGASPRIYHSAWTWFLQVENLSIPSPRWPIWELQGWVWLSDTGTGHKLTFIADRDIHIKRNIQNSGTGDLAFAGHPVDNVAFTFKCWTCDSYRADAQSFQVNTSLLEWLLLRFPKIQKT